MKNTLEQLSEEELDQLISLKEKELNSVNKPKLNKTQESYNPISSFLRGSADSATLGFAPKLTGAALAPILKFIRPELFQDQSLKDLYEQGRDVSRNQTLESANQNPVSSFLGSLAGNAVLPFPAKNIKEGAKLGALYGGAYGLGSSDEGDVGTINADNIISSLYGGVIGAPLGGLGVLGNKLFQKRIPPSEQENELLSISRQFGIPATKGEFSANPSELLKEEAALKGRIGSTNQRNLSEFKDLQKAKTSESAINLRNQIGKSEFDSKGSSAREAISNLQEQALQERKDYGKIYQEAKENVGSIENKNFKEFYNNLESNLLEDVLTKDNVPKAFGELDALKTIFNNPKNQEINIKQLEAWRQGLNQTYKSALNSGDEKTGFALNKIKKEFDNFLNDTLENALEKGDENVLNKFKEGRKLTAEWYKKYGSDNTKNFGKKFIEDVVNRARVGDESLTDEMLVNKIFGTSELGFKPESAVIVKELKKLLPKNDFNKIKIEAAQKILNPLIGENQSAAKYQTGLKKFLNSNKTLAKELFDTNEIKQLNDLSKITEAIFTRKKSLINPSGTAEVILDYLNKKPAFGFIKNVFNKVQLDQNKIAKEINKGTRIEKEPSVILKSLPLALQNVQKDDKQKEDDVGKKIPNDESKLELQNIPDDQLDVLIKNYESQNLLDKDILSKISRVESNNNPNARSRNSSASGLFQFTNSTWKDLVKKYGSEYNISFNDKNDPKAQTILARKLLEDNKSFLEKELNRNPTDGELYLAHFLGANGAKKLINSDPNQLAVRIFPKEASANRTIFFKGSKPRTVEEVYDLITSKI